MQCFMVAATLSVAHGFTAVAPSLRPFSSPSLCAFTPRIVSNSCRVLAHVKRIQQCTRLNVHMTDADNEHAVKRFLGSKRLQYIREKLKSGPDSLNSEKKLLGSRRLALVVSTLLHGVEDTSTKNIKRSVAAKEEATTLVVVDGSSVEKMPSQSKVAETNYAVVEMTDSVEQTIEIDATPAECYQVAAKLDDYPKWVASLESVKVLDTRSDGLAKQAKFAVGAFGQTLDYTLEYTHNVGERLAWKAIAGSVKALVGSYTFAPLDGGKRTRVTYQLALDPGFSIPSMIKKASTKLIVTTALSDLRKYTEKPSTKALVKSLVDKQEAPTPPTPGIAPTAPAAAPLAAEQQPELLMPDSVEQDIDINATPAECYQVAAKLDDYPSSLIHRELKAS